ncbi:MAG: LysE family translocator [Kiritimatiellae bacterium]|nr:LysE family translocator [Kiritimatiellia bacterium]
MIAAYIFASLALIVKPGPDLMFLFATALSHGRKKAFALMAGQMLGCWLWILVLTACVAAVAGGGPRGAALPGVVIAAIQFVGTAYIAYLAWGGVKEVLQCCQSGAMGSSRPTVVNVANVKMLPISNSNVANNRERKRRERGTGDGERGLSRPVKYFFHGVFMAATNPLTLLFFMAFLPGFVDASGASPVSGTFLFGTLFCALVPLVDVPLVLATGFFRVRIMESDRAMLIIKGISAAILCAVTALLAYRAVCAALVF